MSTNQPTAAQPIDLDKPVSKITDGDSARSFVAAWHREHFPTDRTFTNYIMGRNKHCALAGDFAWQLAKALESMGSAALARQQPVARVDRIISASGLAEVSVFLESALKVGTVFYAAPVHAAEPAAPHAGGIVKEAILMGAHAEFSEAMPPLSLTSLGHRNVFKALRKAIQFYINHAAAPAAPHAQAEPVYQMRSLTEPGGWLDTDADGPTSIKRMPHWASVYEFRTLYTAPVPQEAEQAAPAAVMVAPEWIEGAIEGVEILDQLIDSVEKHGNYSQETTIGFLNQVRQCFSDIRALAAQPAAPAVTDAARDVLADAKGGA